MRHVAHAVPAGDDLASRLEVIVQRLRYLSPCHREPERFHIDKDDLVNELKQILADLPRGWTQVSDDSGRLKRASFTCTPSFIR